MQRFQIQYGYTPRHGSHSTTHSDFNNPIQTRYAPDTAAILSLIQIQLQVQMRSKHGCHSDPLHQQFDSPQCSRHEIFLSLIQIPVTVPDTLQTRKSFCYSYRFQLQIQSRYAPDTVAILPLIQNLFPAYNCSTYRCFSVTHSEYRYTSDTAVILIFIQSSNTLTTQIRSRHGRHSFAHIVSVSRYSLNAFQTRIPF